MMLDRPYPAKEIVALAITASQAMGDTPESVKLAVFLGAASTMLRQVQGVGPLGPEMNMAIETVNHLAEFFLDLCHTGPVTTGTQH